MPYPFNGAITPAGGDKMKDAFTFIKNSFFTRSVSLLKGTTGSGIHKENIETQDSTVPCYVKYLSADVMRQLQTGPEISPMATLFFDPDKLRELNLLSEEGLANFEASTDRFVFDAAVWYIFTNLPVGYMEDTPNFPIPGYQLVKVTVKKTQGDETWPGKPLQPTD